MDGVSYQRRGTHNRLRMTKRLVDGGIDN
jgi:hypothetical protein